MEEKKENLMPSSELVQFSLSLSHVQFYATPWAAARQVSLSITNFQSALKLMSTEAVIPSNHLILCHPPLLPPSIFPSITVFSNESVCHNRWPKYQSLSFSISPSSEYSGLISFRIDWLDLLAVQKTLLRVFYNTTVQKHQNLSPQFYSSTLISIHDYWKNHGFDQMDLCRQSNDSAF